MEPALYESHQKLQDSNWWFRGMRSIGRALLPPGFHTQLALDVGCGAGGNLPLLSSLADEVLGVDLSPHALEASRTRLPNAKLSGGRAEALPLKSNRAGLVWLFNVIEHIADDAAALRETARVLSPGGTALVATSASMALWSDHDVANHHERRYQPAQLKTRLQEAGLQVERMTHANAALFAPTAVVAAFQRARARFAPRSTDYRNPLDVPAALDRALAGLLAAEERWLTLADLPFGVSLFAVARKP